MNFKENIKIAIFSIRTNLLRSLLTMLGIIIGVASVIAIVTCGNGGRDFIVNMIKDMGQNNISIMLNTQVASNSDYITPEDVKAIKKLDSVDYVSPFMLSIGSFKTDRESGLAALVGGSADLDEVLGVNCEYGRFFTTEEVNAARQVCVIDATGALTLFGEKDVIGKYIEFSVNGNTVRLKVIGVTDMASTMGGSTEEMLENQAAMLGGTENMMKTSYIYTPSTIVTRVMGGAERYENIYIASKDEAYLDAAGSAVKSLLETRHNNADRNMYTVTNMATYIDLLDTVINVFTTFIAAVGAISLLVGGIGVMNIMYVSVSERTREIGIRKALGARTGTIMFQFLTESVILCMIGGIIGMILGISGAALVSHVMNIPMEIKLSTILLAVGFSSAIGIFFGIYPARKAAKMAPIEALRRD